MADNIIGASNPVKLPLAPVKVVEESDGIKDIHFAEVWCTEVVAVSPQMVGTEWIDRKAAFERLSEFGKATVVVIAELAKYNRTHFSCPVA